MHEFIRRIGRKIGEFGKREPWFETWGIPIRNGSYQGHKPNDAAWQAVAKLKDICITSDIGHWGKVGFIDVQAASPEETRQKILANRELIAQAWGVTLTDTLEGITIEPWRHHGDFDNPYEQL